MATIKSYTDISQSKKLAEILQIESADMIYRYDYNEHCHNTIPEIPKVTIWDDPTVKDLPAWSLSALLNILKYPELVQTCDEKWSIVDWTGQHPKCLYGKDTPISACVEMIIKLKERDLL